jgi:hypothetical protein
MSPDLNTHANSNNSDLPDTAVTRGGRSALHSVRAAPGETFHSLEQDRRPRKLNVEACRGDDLLSHAIEYLTDARRLPCGRLSELSPEEPDVQSIVVLMEARRQVYIACPVIERRSGLHLFSIFSGRDRRRT